jgi:methionyl aminopeptidase
VTVAVGRVPETASKLISATRDALAAGIDAIRPGGRVGDIGQVIEDFALSRGYEVVRDYCGHGIGRNLHEEPPVHNFCPDGGGPLLRLGMVICIEPMLNLGTAETAPQPDGWTVKTADGKLSAHFEHTVAVTERGPQVLTLP